MLNFFLNGCQPKLTSAVTQVTAEVYEANLRLTLKSVD